MEQYVILLAVIFGYLYYRYWMNGENFTKIYRADGKTVIITGADSGIGKETAIEMAERGARVIMACRSLKKAESVRDHIIRKTKNPNVKAMYLDLASMKSIRSFAQTFLDEEPRLDVLINNAGVMGVPKTLTEDGFEMHMGVNHLGHFLLTLLMIDRLKESRPSRIVTVSSWGHTFVRFDKKYLNFDGSYNRFNAYLQSKLANALFTMELGNRLKGTSVSTACIHPGVVHTEISRHLNTLSFILTRGLCSFFSKIFLRSTKSGAQNSLCVSLDDNFLNCSGVYIDNLRFGQFNPEVNDEKLRKWFWERSEKLTGIHFPINAPSQTEDDKNDTEGK